MPTRVTPEQIKMGRAVVEELAEAGGRDAGRFDVTIFGVGPDADQIHALMRLGRTGQPCCSRPRSGRTLAGT